MSEMFTQAANHDITYDMNYVCLVCTYVHVLLLSKRQKSIIELKSVQVFKNSLLCPYHPVSVFYVLYRGVVRNFERGQRASPPHSTSRTFEHILHTLTFLNVMVN